MPSLDDQAFEPSYGRVTKELQSVISLIKSDQKIYLLIALIVCVTTAFSYANGYSNKIQLFAYMYAMQWVVLLSIGFMMVGYLILLIVRLEKRPLRCYWNKLVVVWSYRAHIISAFILLTAISAFISSFSTMKSLIPIVNPFEYDQLFHELDLIVFGGVEPWRLAFAFFDSPLITMTINILYKVWFLLIWGVLSYFLLAVNAKARQQYLISWTLCWFLLGSVLAMVFSSAGPAFVERLDGSDTTYTELMALLASHNEWLLDRDWLGVWALGTQDNLWEAYDSGKEMLGSGISAMPSMHVSMAVLMALGCWSINKWLGVFMWVFAATIFIGSFTLGWHYAVDGLVSFPLTWMIWYLVGKFLNR
tara:strand:- start:581 stop:1666 length:1086 start_codon:yes stop_codon:yes gene_type:complete